MNDFDVFAQDLKSIAPDTIVLPEANDDTDDHNEESSSSDEEEEPGVMANGKPRPNGLPRRRAAPRDLEDEPYEPDEDEEDGDDEVDDGEGDYDISDPEDEEYKLDAEMAKNDRYINTAPEDDEEDEPKKKKKDKKKDKIEEPGGVAVEGLIMELSMEFDKFNSQYISLSDTCNDVSIMKDLVLTRDSLFCNKHIKLVHDDPDRIFKKAKGKFQQVEEELKESLGAVRDGIASLCSARDKIQTQRVASSTIESHPSQVDMSKQRVSTTPNLYDANWVPPATNEVKTPKVEPKVESKDAPLGLELTPAQLVVKQFINGSIGYTLVPAKNLNLWGFDQELIDTANKYKDAVDAYYSRKRSISSVSSSTEQQSSEKRARPAESSLPAAAAAPQPPPTPPVAAAPRRVVLDRRTNNTAAAAPIVNEQEPGSKPIKQEALSKAPVRLSLKDVAMIESQLVIGRARLGNFLETFDAKLELPQGTEAYDINKRAIDVHNNAPLPSTWHIPIDVVNRDQLVDQLVLSHPATFERFKEVCYFRAAADPVDNAQDKQEWKDVIERVRGTTHTATRSAVFNLQFTKQSDAGDPKDPTSIRYRSRRYIEDRKLHKINDGMEFALDKHTVMQYLRRIKCIVEHLESVGTTANLRTSKPSENLTYGHAVCALLLLEDEVRAMFVKHIKSSISSTVLQFSPSIIKGFADGTHINETDYTKYMF